VVGHSGKIAVRSLEEYLDRSQSTSSVAELKTAYEETLVEAGFENHVMASLTETRIGEVLWSNMPDGLLDSYNLDEWGREDPFAQETRRSSRPFLWSDIATRPDLPHGQRLFMQQLRDMGLRCGIVFPIHGPGGRCDAISISTGYENKAGLARIPFLHTVCWQTWCRYQQLRNNETCHDADVLTRRELEILYWVMRGKSNREIGLITTISRKTVEFHLRKIMDKLRASSRMTAVVIALQRGLLPL